VGITNCCQFKFDYAYTFTKYPLYIYIYIYIYIYRPTHTFYFSKNLKTIPYDSQYTVVLSSLLGLTAEKNTSIGRRSV